MEKSRVLRCLFEPVEIIRVLAEVDEAAAGIVGVRPGYDQDRIVGPTFNGPIREHLSILASS
jgi:hypothetical protein